MIRLVTVSAVNIILDEEEDNLFHVLQYAYIFIHQPCLQHQSQISAGTNAHFLCESKSGYDN